MSWASKAALQCWRPARALKLQSPVTAPQTRHLQRVWLRSRHCSCAPAAQPLIAPADARPPAAPIAADAAEDAEVPPAWPAGKKKRRLDELCCEVAPQYSKNVIQGFITTGKVFVGGHKVIKCGHQVKREDDIDIRAQVPTYVCRAGLKLEAALAAFKLNNDMRGAVALDAGVSTGGFTDCLLQHGAARVFGVDVGYGQVAEKIRTDARVTLMERTNLRHLQAAALDAAVDIVTLDLSFISVLKVLPAVVPCLRPGADVIVLIKPQFEAGKEKVSRGGIVRDEAVHKEVIESVTLGALEHGLRRQGLIESPVRGAQAGNIEFLAHFVYDMR